jgi:hypothetical protein
VRLLVAVLAIGLGAADAQAASCRNYGSEVQAAIKGHVESLRMVEREAADRIAGLDTRPYDYLLGQARAATAIIADKDKLAEEDALDRCRNFVPRVRHACAAAAQALVMLIGELNRGTASAASNDDYSRGMPICERYMGLAPLKTTLRTG